MATYRTTGTCSSAINYEVEDGIVTKCQFVGGCPGNTAGVARLAIGRKVEDVIALLKGIPCRNGTSCPDQLARALEQTVKREFAL
ncbi:MAG: TIGR03905 family TSCPD domain-containing protein [Kiritimatiellae bacterium]|nr:TIGR03905 family TSCPD domain-containing protein [Kiritimatiellia bacterium]